MAIAFDISLLAYPTLSQAADMLGVTASTLSRREDLVFERMGERDKRIPAREVLRQAAIHRRRSINAVAADLVEYAQRHAPESAQVVQDEVEQFFAELEKPATPASEFLAEAKRALPAKLYREVEKVYAGGRGRRPAAITRAR